MGRSTWACFDCRQSVRRETYFRGEVRCPECGRECTCLGHKIPLPPRRDEAGWAVLRDEHRRTELDRLAALHRASVERKHAIEREIARLEELPFNRDRARLIRELQGELDDAT